MGSGSVRVTVNLAARSRKGIYDKDPSFLRNFGWDGKRGYQIDIGSFYRKEGKSGRQAYDQSLLETLGPVCIWLDQVDPEMKRSFDQKIQAVRERGSQWF